MELTDLKKKAAKENIQLSVIEKDYALTVVLIELSKSALKEKIIFKGGTAIKKIYFSKARFSEDLDFSANNVESNEIIKVLKTIFENKKINDVAFDKLEIEKTSAGLRIALKFVSLLNYPQRIRFDFSFRANPALEPIEKEILNDYFAKEKNLIKTMQLEEIFAEKIHSLMSRTVARDLHDYWFLMKNKVNANQNLINKKFAYYNESFNAKKLIEKLNEFEPSWKTDLKQFLNKVPEFTEISKEVMNNLNLI